MSSKENEVTVSDLSQLIEAREETRAELRLLAIRAYEHWLELESRIEELETRLDTAHKSDTQLRAAEPVEGVPSERRHAGGAR
jgi:BMFP domain-containing protein YqiC